jgi:hypothetical protein
VRKMHIRLRAALCAKHSCNSYTHLRKLKYLSRSLTLVANTVQGFVNVYLNSTSVEVPKTVACVTGGFSYLVRQGCINPRRLNFYALALNISG